MRLLIFAVLGVVLAAGEAPALQFSVAKTDKGFPFILARGPIVEGDDDKLLKLLFSGQAEERFLSLDSVGGDLVEAIALGKTLRFFGFETYVADDAGCFSACFFVFIAGDYRYAAPSAQIGVHQFSGGTEIQSRQGATQQIVATLMKYTGEMGVYPGAMERAFATPPGDMHILSGEELMVFNVVKQSTGLKFTKREASRIQISHAEYLKRRKRLFDRNPLDACEGLSGMPLSTCLFSALSLFDLPR